MPSTAPSGGAIDVTTGSDSGGDTKIDVSVAGDTNTTSYPVGPGGTTSIPVPAVPDGTVLVVSVGRGPTARVFLVRIVSTF